MTEYTGDVGPLGPLVPVGLWVGTAYVGRHYGGRAATYTALIDTGANITAISPHAQAHLRAMVLSSHPVARPGTDPVFVDTVDIRLKIGGHTGRQRWFELEAVVTQPVTPGVDVLIGQDLLRQVVFTWDGPRERFKIRYR